MCSCKVEEQFGKEETQNLFKSIHPRVDAVHPQKGKKYNPKLAICDLLK